MERLAGCPLYRPQGERHGDLLLSAAFTESATELIRYYEDVLRVAAKHRKRIGKHPELFWMRPVIFARDAFTIDFPWYDTLENAMSLLDALVASDDGVLFDECEQGWEVQAIAAGDRLFLRQGDFDSGEEQCAVVTDRARLAAQIPAVRERTVQLVEQLTAALGRDHWSRRR